MPECRAGPHHTYRSTYAVMQARPQFRPQFLMLNQLIVILLINLVYNK